MTLRQIAQHSGVSIQTVSRILRGEHERHHPKTCDRVMAAAKALNYRPNLLGRALQSGKTHTVGLVRLGVGDRQQSLNIYGMSSEAKASGYQMLVTIEAGYQNDGDKEFMGTVDELLGRRVDGLIVHRSVPLTPVTRRYMAGLHVPVVYASWGPPKQAHHVKIDRQHGMQKVVEHLKQLGHRRVAFFPSPGSMDFPGHHILPMQRICKQADMTLDTVTPDPRFAKMAAEEAWTHDSVKRYLAEHPTGERATGLIFPGAYTVQGGLIAIAENELSVPNDMSVVALEDSPLSQMSRPAVTALSSDWEAFGRLIFSTLHNVIHQPDTKPQVHVIEPQLIIRQSTGPAPDITHHVSGQSGHHLK